MNTNIPSRPKITLLVLNYCSLEDTLACVEVIRKINYDNFELLVIDNASPDGSGAMLANSIPQHEFLQLPRNTGYAGGNNTAMFKAIAGGADYILILNPDIRLSPDTLSTYVEIMQAHPNAAGLNSVQLQADQNTFDRSFSLGVLKPCGHHGTTLSESPMPDVFESDTIFGAALMLSVPALKQVGGFDPLYFAYGEETDLCRRFRMHGFKLLVTTRSPVTHLRTVYEKPLSRFVLFLKLKGYYLSIFKNPENSTRAACKRIFRDIKNALKGNKNFFPYDTYPYDNKIIIKTLAWLVVFLPVAWLHKRKEQKPAPHYIDRP